MAAPIFLSPLVGGLIGWIGFEIVFVIVTLLLLAGWLLTLGLHEPRTRTVASVVVEPETL
jgi:cytochrome c oxidase assembly factor CtaG